MIWRASWLDWLELAGYVALVWILGRLLINAIAQA